MNANFNSAVLAEQVGVSIIASPSASGMKKKRSSPSVRYCMFSWFSLMVQEKHKNLNYWHLQTLQTIILMEHSHYKKVKGQVIKCPVHTAATATTFGLLQPCSCQLHICNTYIISLTYELLNRVCQDYSGCYLCYTGVIITSWQYLSCISSQSMKVVSLTR